MRLQVFIFFLIIKILPTSGQVPITSNGWFLEVGGNDRYVVYFEANNDEEDDFIEGSLFLYDVEQEKSSELSTKTYILDFVITRMVSPNLLMVSDGQNIESYDLTNGEVDLVIKTEDDCLIGDFVTNNTADELYLSTEKQGKGEYRVFKMNLTSKSKEELYREDRLLNSGEMLTLKLAHYENYLLLRNLYNEVLAIDIETKDVTKIDKASNGLFAVEKGFLYYTKPNSLVEYNIMDGNKLDIIDGESVEFSFIDSYKNGLFLSFNDNVFVYNKKEQTIKNIESLPKARYVYFSESIAISADEEEISIVRNSNK